MLHLRSGMDSCTSYRFGACLNLLKLILLHLPFLAQSTGKTINSLLNYRTKQGRQLPGHNTCALATGQAESSHPHSNQRAGNNSYVLNCTESSCLLRANRDRFFQNTRTFAKHWRLLRTCFISQLLWKLRLSKVYFIIR